MQPSACAYSVIPTVFEETFFSLLWILDLFVKNQLFINAWVSFLAFYSVPLMEVSCFVVILILCYDVLVTIYFTMCLEGK